MSEVSPVPIPAEALVFLECWSECLGQVLAQIRGSAVPSAVLTDLSPQIAAAAENDLWILAALGGGLRGEISLRLPAAAVVHFAQILMGDSSPAPADMSPDHREAALELVRQVAGLVSTSLKTHWGEVQLRVEAAPGMPSWSQSATAWIRAGDEPGPAALIELHLSAALVAALREKTDVATRADPEDQAVASAPAEQQSAATGGGVNLGLLMDVELAVSLRFGSRRLLLREVLELGPGGVLELDRNLNEPVDLLLDGRLLARGEVVVMDGDYALRVTEIAPSQS